MCNEHRIDHFAQSNVLVVGIFDLRQIFGYSNVRYRFIRGKIDYLETCVKWQFLWWWLCLVRVVREDVDMEFGKNNKLNCLARIISVNVPWIVLPRNLCYYFFVGLCWCDAYRIKIITWSIDTRIPLRRTAYCIPSLYKEKKKTINWIL